LTSARRGAILVTSLLYINAEGMMRETVRQVDAARRYMREMLGAMLLYVVVLGGAIVALRSMDEGSPLRWVVALLPMVPALLAAAAILRFFGRMDELARRQLTEGLAFAFAASALLVLTLGFLQVGGMAPVSIWWVWVGMGAAWVAGSLLSARRYR
jgi:hypothetical protein